MKICWFDDHRLGLVRDGAVYDVSPALKCLPASQYPPNTKGDALIANLQVIREEINDAAQAAPLCQIGDVKLLSPIANPTKIIGTPVNYLKHVEEADAQREVFSARYRGSIEEQG